MLTRSPRRDTFRLCSAVPRSRAGVFDVNVHVVSYLLLELSSPRVRESWRRVWRPALLLLLSACASAGTTRGGGVRIVPDSGAAAAITGERGNVGNAGSATRTLGVTPFRLPERDSALTPLGYALADLLTTDLSRSASLQLVERSRLGEVLRELNLTRGGRVDSVSAPRVGLLLRAQRLLLGSLDTLPGGDLRISVRIADVETGVVEQAIDARAPLADVLAAEKIVVFRLFDALGVTLTPAERVRIEARQTTSLEALKAFGRGVEADILGEPRRAVAEFSRALRADPSFRAAADRSSQVRTSSQDAGTASALLPGIRGIGAPVTGVVDRLNRPLDYVTIQSRPLGGPGDPAFPTTMVTVVIIVRRP